MAGSVVLGIDGLPLGRMAVVAAGGAVEASFALEGEGGGVLALPERVQAAVAEVRARWGADPAEVRLVLVDDGGDGSEASAVGEWLASQRIAFRLLDLVGPDDPGGPDGPGPAGPGQAGSADARSEARARDAALF